MKERVGYGFQLVFRMKGSEDEEAMENTEIEYGEITQEARPPLTDEQIKELALMMYRNEIFTSLQVHHYDANMMGMIFMPLILMDEVGVQHLKLHNINHVYSFMGDCMPRSVNGYPCFHSMYTLTQDEAERLVKKHEQVVKLMESL
jgi:hypothetical protein